MTGAPWHQWFALNLLEGLDGPGHSRQEGAHHHIEAHKEECREIEADAMGGDLHKLGIALFIKDAGYGAWKEDAHQEKGAAQHTGQNTGI